MAHRLSTTARAVVVLLVLAAVVFGWAVDFDFVWDDKNLVRDNPFLRRDDTLWRAFVSDFWQLTNSQHDSGMYRPLVLVSYWVESRLWGAGGMHATNLLLHLCSALCLFGLGRRVGLQAGAATFAAALWLVHPIQAEAVGNIASRTDLLSTLGTLGGILLWTRTDRYRWFGPLALFLAMLSKESSVVAPLLAMLVAGTIGVGRGVPALSPALAWIPYGVLRTVALSAGVSPESHPWEGGSRILFYLGRFVLPLPQAPVHVPPSFGGWFSAGTLVLIAVLAVLTFRFRARLGVVCTLGLSWFFIAILPVAELVPLGARFADLLLHLPAVGLALAVAGQPVRVPRVVPIALLAAATVTTALRLQVWRDDLSLWMYGFEHRPKEPLIVLNLANALSARGEESGACALLQKNLEHLQNQPVSSIHARTYYNLGNCERRARAYERAIPYFQKALAISEGTLRQAAENLAITYMDLNRNQEAYEVTRRLTQTDADYAGSFYLHGVMAARLGRFDEATAAAQRALAIEPGHADSQKLLEKLGAVRRRNP